MARLDELDLDDESEEENQSVEERVKAQGGSSAATPAAGADKGDGGGDEEGSGKEEGDNDDEEASVVDPRRAAGAAGAGDDDKPKKRRPRFTEDHIIGANGALRCVVCVRGEWETMGWVGSSSVALFHHINPLDLRPFSFFGRDGAHLRDVPHHLPLPRRGARGMCVCD